MLLLLLIGCGDEESGGESESASRALITARDFPGDVHTRKSVVSEAPCSPQPLLRGARTSESSTFVLGGADAQQVVGVFPSEREASSAFDSLSSPKRRQCIEQALRIYSVTRAAAGSIVKPLPVRSLDLGDEARLMRFLIEQPTTTDLRVDSVLARVDRAVTDLLFIGEVDSVSNDLVEGVAEKATTHLDAGFD